jgi:predicted anti-sigma-YlaC factor YlaD
MMNCSKIRDLLPDYSVEMLEGRARRMVQEHLAGCEGCREELRVQDSVMALVEQHGAHEPPPGLFNAVRNQIESGVVAQQRPAWWAWLYTGPARATGMGLAMAALAVSLLMPSNGPSTPSELVPVHPTVSASRGMATTALAGSIRQHAMSASEGPLADRVAWEAMAQIATQDNEKEGRPE